MTTTDYADPELVAFAEAQAQGIFDRYVMPRLFWTLCVPYFPVSQHDKDTLRPKEAIR